MEVVREFSPKVWFEICFELSTLKRPTLVEVVQTELELKLFEYQNVFMHDRWYFLWFILNT